jgi:hypothetical protein
MLVIASALVTATLRSTILIGIAALIPEFASATLLATIKTWPAPVLGKDTARKKHEREDDDDLPGCFHLKFS